MAKDPFRFFRIEATELVDRIRQGVGALTVGTGQSATAQDLMRTAHTLKGAAAVVELSDLSQTVHGFEQHLAPVANDEEQLAEAKLKSIVECVDQIVNTVSNLPNADSVRDRSRTRAEKRAAAAPKAKARPAPPAPAAPKPQAAATPPPQKKPEAPAPRPIKKKKAKNTDPYRFFRMEAAELIEKLTSGLHDLESQPDDQAPAQALMRVAHTLKGAAAVVELIELSQLAKTLEGHLAPLGKEGQPLPEGGLDDVNTCIEAIRKSIDDLPGPEAEEARAAEIARSTPATGRRSIRPSRAEPSRAPSARHSTHPSHAPGQSRPSAAPPPQTSGGGSIETIKISVDVLDSLVRSAATARSHVIAIADVVRQNTRQTSGAQVEGDALREQLEAISDNAQRHLELLWSDLHDARLLPATVLTDLLEAATEQTARLVGKDVAFIAEGTDCRLDARVISTLYPGLLHVVRNAVDHGIEAEDARRALGKPTQGTVRIKLEPHAGYVGITCRDDGSGLDEDAVFDAARAGGFMTGGETDGMAATDLILSPSFSTRKEASMVSGRGVGLDVLANAATTLNASLRIQNHPGAGLQFTILVPQSVASMRALAVTTEQGHTQWLPFGALSSVQRFRPQDTVKSPSGPCLLVGAHTVPLMTMTDRPVVAEVDESSEVTQTAVLMESEQRLVGLVVERVGMTDNVVVHPVPAMASADASVLGATFDSSGTPQLVLNPRALITTRLAAAPSRRATRRKVAVLVIDDSLTTRMVEKGILEGAGYEVALATSAEEGMRMARTRKYDLFLCDVEMPGMNGFEFVAATRKDPDLQQTPAVLVTTLNAPEDKRRGIDAGASAYIVKNELEETSLLGLVRRLTRQD